MNQLLKMTGSFLGLMIFTLPFTVLPERYRLPILGGNLPQIFLLLAIIFFSCYVVKARKIEFPLKKYFTGFFLWSLFCLIWGVWNFPYYDASIDEVLRNSRMVVIASEFFPALQENACLLHVKMFLSYFWYMLKGFFFPFSGIAFIIYGMFRMGMAGELRTYLYWGIYGLSSLMVFYSIPEVIWLWTGNETCAWILSSINVHLYDPVLYNGWWPPLLWQGQLRSLCLEPSYFGIITAFLVPFLAIDAQKKINTWKILLIFLLIFMIFMTKARTATVIYLGESAVFFLLSLLFRYPGWKKVLLVWAVITISAFSVYLLGESMLHPNMNTKILTEKYFDENVTSVVGENKRSNSARFGNTVAMIKIGVDYPVTGVGMGLHAPYMEERIPEFAKDNHEIRNWVKDMREKTFLESGLPVLNEYAAIFAWEGIFGLIFFLLLPLGVIVRGISGRRKQRDFQTISLLTALIGQLACMLSSEMFLTYPLTLWLVYCVLEKREKEWINN